jgi:uncharacterized protein (TIGR02246 family)
MGPNHASIEEFLDRVVTSWKTNDGAEVANLFTEDASLVNPFGERADGRADIAAMYSAYFGTMLRDTSTAVTLGAVRGIDATHALIDGEQTIVGPDGEPVLAVHLTALLRRDGDDWRLLDARPYVVALPG